MRDRRRLFEILRFDRGWKTKDGKRDRKHEERKGSYTPLPKPPNLVRQVQGLAKIDLKLKGVNVIIRG